MLGFPKQVQVTAVIQQARHVRVYVVEEAEERRVVPHIGGPAAQSQPRRRAGGTRVDADDAQRGGIPNRSGSGGARGDVQGSRAAARRPGWDPEFSEQAGVHHEPREQLHEGDLSVEALGVGGLDFYEGL